MSEQYSTWLDIAAVVVLIVLAVVLVVVVVVMVVVVVEQASNFDSSYHYNIGFWNARLKQKEHLTAVLADRSQL